MSGTLLMTSVFAVVLLIPFLVSLLLYLIIKQRKTKTEEIRDYGACDKNNPIPLEITVTKPDAEEPLNDVEGKKQEIRRCTMPCIFPSDHRHSYSYGESSESLNDDSKDILSLFRSGLMSPARRFSDNIVTEYHGDTRKNSVRPDRFSIVTLNLESVFGSPSDLAAYDILSLYGRGKLCFSLVFNDHISRLYVTINKAVYLNSSKLRNLTGFYVKIYLISNDSQSVLQMFRTEIVTANKNPMFEQTFSYFLSKSSISNVKLKFVVKESHNMPLKHENVGGFIFDLSADELIFHPEWFQELWRDLRGDTKVTENLGEVLISLKYSRDSSTRMTVNIQRAKNLRIRANDNCVFVRCTVLLGNKAINSKRSGTVKKDISSPLLDHECIFNMENGGVMEMGIVVHMCSRSKIGFSHLLGKLQMGSTVFTDDKSSISHWMDMINYPGRSITKWHKLV